MIGMCVSLSGSVPVWVVLVTGGGKDSVELEGMFLLRKCGCELYWTRKKEKLDEYFFFTRKMLM